MNNDPNLFYRKMHRVGIWMTVVAMILFFGVPFVACTVYDIMPTMKEVFMVCGGLILIFFPMTFAEMIAETPVMGTGTYIACISGNVANIKLPACLNAVKIADVNPESSAADALKGYAICVSSIVTMVMVAAGVVLLVPLKPLLTSPAVATASNYVLPALFGCIIFSVFGEHVGGGVIIHGRLKTVILPVIIACALYFFVIPDMYANLQGFIAILLLLVIYYTSKYMYKKGIVTVELPEDSKAPAAAETEVE